MDSGTRKPLEPVVTFTDYPALWAGCYVCGKQPVVACRRFSATNGTIVISDVCEEHKECGSGA